MAAKRKASDVFDLLSSEDLTTSNSNPTNGSDSSMVNGNFEALKVDGGRRRVCKCEVEKQDKAVQVSDLDLHDGEQERMDTTIGQVVGVDDTGGILYDVSTTIDFS